MNVSKLCIDTTIDDINSLPSINSTSSERQTPLPSISKIPSYINDNNAVNRVCNKRSPKYHQYQLQYQMQHQFLKPLEQQNEIEAKNQNQQALPSNSHDFYPYQHIVDDRSSNSSCGSISAPQANAKQPEISSSSLEPTSKLQNIIEQCTMVYQKVSKYRVDPLRESERNQIIDDVFDITENMLTSLKELEETNQEHPPETNTNSNNAINPLIQPINSTNCSANMDYELIRQARNLQKNFRPKYRRRNRANLAGNICHSCNTTDTPEWRRGPDGARTLCNACGLHYAKLLRKGSMTVQTHNYMLEASPSETNSPTPKSIQFPVVYVNDNNMFSQKYIPSDKRITEISD
ncbi:MAG: hypothetical protein EXX96DRAFT_575891 [Benjaminiella poitrasii]|nr:MAG: hypothetical protein EXX96DRAFT_575891 [Benjaminiella poitrasii]